MINSDNKLQFRVHGIKRDGTVIDKYFLKINTALTYMWRIKEVDEILLTIVDNLAGTARVVFAKTRRRRAINSRYANVLRGLPVSSGLGTDWFLLPSKFNDLLNNASNNKSPDKPTISKKSF